MSFKKDLITVLDECDCGKLLGTCVQFVFIFCMHSLILIHTLIYFVQIRVY